MPVVDARDAWDAPLLTPWYIETWSIVKRAFWVFLDIVNYKLGDCLSRCHHFPLFCRSRFSFRFRLCHPSCEDSSRTEWSECPPRTRSRWSAISKKVPKSQRCNSSPRCRWEPHFSRRERRSYSPSHLLQWDRRRRVFGPRSVEWRKSRSPSDQRSSFHRFWFGW